ncbi:hypothetical protein CDL15_Pgr019673 [Punica granatum]|uniref:Uncharacterized protein n=1 Tax=Punica granatum TaxID=22663 RepID=A0A218X639_PUNGR|nr:hypothetical protein CDL15_Pgr019673 [Punica granatum]
MRFRQNLPKTAFTLKWLGFVTAVWVQAISGNNNSFSNYSDALKSIMNLTQLELNILSVTKDVGKAFGLLAGLASDRLPTWMILLIGSVEGLVGYGAQWLIVSEKITVSYWQMCIFVCMGGNSTTWMNTAVLVTCIRNFQKDRGPVSGILKGFVGLSTAIFTNVCSALFSDSATSFLLMLSLVPLGVCLAAMVFLREVPPADNQLEEKEEARYFMVTNGIAIVVALYLLAYDFSGSHGQVFSLVFVGILLSLLASPLLIPLYAFFKTFKTGCIIESNDDEGIDEQLLSQETAFETQQTAQQTLTGATSEAETELIEAKRKPVIVNNNIGQIGLALGYDDVSVFVSLFSIGGFFGRIISGSGSEYLIKKMGSPRPLWTAASQIIMSLGLIVMALALPGSLYIGSIVVGLCYGIRLSVTVPTASELFGLKHYGLVYNVLILNLPLGSFLFSGLLAGLIYDMEATTTTGGGDTCSGAHCYRLVFIIMSITCLIGFVLDMLLAIKTKGIYAKIQASKNSNKSPGSSE